MTSSTSWMSLYLARGQVYALPGALHTQGQYAHHKERGGSKYKSAQKRFEASLTLTEPDEGYPSKNVKENFWNISSTAQCFFLFLRNEQKRVLEAISKLQLALKFPVKKRRLRPEGHACVSAVAASANPDGIYALYSPDR
ncbi:hypothetical protein BKA60DRAFT_546358 [Fusarium oxysporum]|nr:hypothetical protein BKA60DRAFT_546358 [Fusarium oxysporum]